MNCVPKLRFKDDNSEDYPNWDSFPLGKIANIKKGFTPSTNDSSYWGGELPWLSIADMKKGKYLFATTKSITKKGSKQKKPVSKNSLIMSFKLTIGRLAILGEDMYTNEAICNFQWKNNLIITEFMYYFLNSINILKYGSQAAKGITLNNDSLETIPVKIPSFEEQEKIAKFLSKVDEKVAILESKHQLWNSYKKGIMQQIFSQKLRFEDEMGNNYSNWEEKTLGEVGVIITGNTPSTKNKNNFANGKYIWVTPTDIGNSRI
ncbi:MAG: restriction endonuclease subunit S, partial [Methanobrevibacter sp.]|nr:restriction endonuclease subunit S [Candidatus Methanovirga meridionalis]